MVNNGQQQTPLGKNKNVLYLFEKYSQTMSSSFFAILDEFFVDLT